jgi:hypothetical protein
MAWTNIPNANLAAGAPIRSVDTLALRDNISAVPNGDSGAPRNTDASIADGITGGTNWFPIGYTGFFIFENTGERRYSSARVLRGGTYRFRTRVRLENNDSGSVLGFRVYQNGVALGSQGTVTLGAFNWGTITLSDVTLTTGSVVEFRFQTITANRQWSVYTIQAGVSNTLKILPLSSATSNGDDWNTSQGGLPI